MQLGQTCSSLFVLCGSSINLVGFRQANGEVLGSVAIVSLYYGPQALLLSGRQTHAGLYTCVYIHKGGQALSVIVDVTWRN